MSRSNSRFSSYGLIVALAAFIALTVLHLRDDLEFGFSSRTPRRYAKSSYDWSSHGHKYPVPESETTGLPVGSPRALPRIQHVFSSDHLGDLKRDLDLQHSRRQAVKAAFQRTWKAYREFAWGHDELQPLSLRGSDPFNGWAATIVDSLDTLWIMNMKSEFWSAVNHVAIIDWNNSTSPRCNLFETNIRYLGGLLAAYDLSGEHVLLEKAIELGDMLYAAFDTPNRFPPFVFEFDDLRTGNLEAGAYQSAAAIGTLSLEFTRLAQLTGNSKYYDAIDRIKKALRKRQGTTLLPGLWPNFINIRDDFQTKNNIFRLGADGDSLYEYLPKMHILLGGLDSAYEEMYRYAMDTTKAMLLFRPMIPSEEDILMLGTAIVNRQGHVDRVPELEHLTCFAGGMFAVAGRVFGLDEDVQIGERLARGCAWAYRAMPSGIMPEQSHFIRCETLEQCAWDEERWVSQTDGDVPKGYRFANDKRYLLRPEAIESLFVLYRVTGKSELQDLAWDMFQAIERNTKTDKAYAAIKDVTTSDPVREDNMESFFLSETLKYLYMLFSDPEEFSLDDWVFNTEAHPFKRPLS